MNKTPDEIKKGLECCSGIGNVCDGCPYANGECGLFSNVATDALFLIQQLEAANAELLTKCERLERERDAAVGDISQGSRCAVCRNFFKNGGDCSGGVYCIPLRFEWRGVKEE